MILKCVVVGSPTPTVAWKTPNGTKFNEVASLENEASVPMNSNQEFGIYTCEATNGVGDADTRTVQVQQISKIAILHGFLTHLYITAGLLTQYPGLE